MTLEHSRVSMSLSASVYKALEDVDNDHIQTYLEWIREVASHYTRAAHRSAFFCVITALTFELLIASASTELTIGPVKLGQNGFVLAFLPSMAALFLCQALVYELKQSRAFMVSEITLKAWDSAIQGNDLGLLLVPPHPMHWNTSGGLVVNRRTPFDKVDNIASRVLFSGLLLGLTVFFVHAFIYLFGVEEVNRPVILVNLFIVVLSLGLGGAYYIGARRTR